MNFKILKNIFWLFSERGVIILSALIVSAIMARSLGVEDYGRFQYAISVFNIFLAATYVCGAEVVVPALVNNEGRAESNIINDAFVLRVISAIFAFLLLVLYVAVVEDGSTFWLLLILGVMLFLKEPPGVVIAWLQSRTNSRPSSLIQMVASVVKLAVVGGVVIVGHGTLTNYALAWVLESFVVAVFLIVYYVVFSSQPTKIYFSFEGVCRLAKKGMPFWVGIMGMYALQRSDRLLLNYLSTPSELGLYAAAMQIIENINLLGSILIISVAPSLVYAEVSGVAVRKKVISLALVLFSLSLMFVLVLFFFADLVVLLLYGNAFKDASSLLKFMSALIPLFFIDIALSLYINKFGLGGKVVVKWLGAFLAAVAVGVVLIPVYGSFGALSGVLVGYLFAVIYGAALVFRSKTSVK